MKKLIVSLTAFAAVALFAAPSADAAYTISGNGSDSYNRIRVSSRFRSTRSQHNDVLQENVINIESNTGDNKANDNTGGDTTVTSGNTKTTVTVLNAGASNQMSEGDDCGCVEEEAEVEIKNNGSDSTNKVKLSRSHRFKRMQSNLFTSLNSLGIGSFTGDNEAKDNTGGEDGDVEVTTGTTTTDVHVENLGGDNVL